MTSATTGRRLRIARYSALVAGWALIAGWELRVVPLASAAAIASVFTVSFMTGLRARAVVAHLRGIPGKELSWSAAVFTALAATAGTAFLARAAVDSRLFLVLSFALLSYYVIGKATCQAAGCCRSVLTPFPLPLLEIIATVTTLAAGVWMAYRSPVAALTVVLGGHFLTRAASRFMRAGTIGALATFDVGALGVASIALLLAR